MSKSILPSEAKLLEAKIPTNIGQNERSSPLLKSHTVNKCLRYGKTAPSEDPFLLGSREVNSVGFSVWGVTDSIKTIF
jgi:hypothetical protein